MTIYLDMENTYIMMEDLLRYNHKWQGMFANWSLNGHGRMTWPNGDVYEVF